MILECLILIVELHGFIGGNENESVSSSLTDSTQTLPPPNQQITPLAARGPRLSKRTGEAVWLNVCYADFSRVRLAGAVPTKRGLN